ncbi:MAG TPA: HIT domain-containing protein [Thermoanaerobaculia bacterium]|nr:HIT domain-containing protein [Thermoanaerobaculia bacterium]HUM31259.1 HIT domain-containing protein [Thermoanaerobaculia bacterium]HXK69614.1 HIT domain-containing protein [Thermoanaerobaculia bacterium]
MPILFTPWRYAYIKQGSTGACIFCHASGHEGDPFDVLRLGCTNYSIIMLNRYPYINGHLMVAPRRHTADLAGLSPEEKSDMMDLVAHCTQVLGEVYGPHGYNVGMNLGRVAGAGIEDHLHMHIVPRWNGDHNFMRVLADTRMIPEDLSVTFANLKDRIAL